MPCSGRSHRSVSGNCSVGFRMSPVVVFVELQNLLENQIDPRAMNFWQVGIVEVSASRHSS